MSAATMQLLRDSVQLIEDLVEQRGRPGTLELRVEELFASFEAVLDEDRDGTQPAATADEPAPTDDSVDGFIEFPEPLRANDGDGTRLADLPRTEAQPARETASVPARTPAADPDEAAGDTGSDMSPSRALRIPIDRVDVLVRLVGELSVHRSVFQSTCAQLDQQVEELGLSSERVRRLSSQIEAEREFRPLPTAVAAAGSVYASEPAVVADPSFDPLEMESYTELDRMSRQLTEATSDISALRGQLGRTAEDFSLSLDLLGRLTADIQDRLLQLRMVPVGRLISRLRRTARRTAAEKGKRVEVEVIGGDIELDTTLLDEIADPLLHLLRNAIDHGIESPEVRAMLGKPEVGRFRLVASHAGPEVVLQISDDGSGLDRAALRRAAIRNGLLTAEQAESASPRELFALIFQPGFSTAREVSEISGRGVGLDVVRTAIERLKGSVTVSSVDGQGVTFTLRLPITLALARVALVLVDGEMLAVPFAGIEQILRSEDQTVERIGERSMILVGDRAVPRLDLAEVLQMTPPQTAPASERRLALVLAQGDQEVALGIDRLVEAREVVVRSLGSHLHPLSGISGATILGDGSVVLILNLAELLAGEVAALTPVLQSTGPMAVAGQDEILIVDDSLTVRRALARIVADAGWRPVLARDGLEALQILQDDHHHPRALLLDIEMPRMDGYQLTATLRAQESHRDTPIVIVTSRASERHRQKAFELGADEYLVKPLRENQLVDCLRSVLDGRGGSAN
jgi:chemosensory pili system protein ChpA (sensor histidine kinase/response regulator)